MTIREVLSIMIRRWYIPVTLLACAALLTLMLARDGDVYTSRTVISFTRPTATSLTLSNGNTDESVIAFAGAVVQELNNGKTQTQYSMADAPYYGAGIREGALVDLANSGSQWVSEFRHADVEVHVVGRTSDWVNAVQEKLVDQVLSISTARQTSLGISPNEQITATIDPLTLKIDHVTAARKSQLAAGAAMLAVALLVSGWGATRFDRMRVRQRIASVNQAHV